MALGGHVLYIVVGNSYSTLVCSSSEMFPTYPAYPYGYYNIDEQRVKWARKDYARDNKR